jgi:hypothetical protein
MALVNLVKVKQRTANSGFAQRGHLSFKKASSCLEVSVSFDTLEL